jgi:hypothetical protein
MLVFFLVGIAAFQIGDLRAGMGLVHLGRNVGRCLFWFTWFELLAILGSLTPRRRAATAAEGEPPRGIAPRVFSIYSLTLLAWVLRDHSPSIGWVAWFGGLALLLVMERRWGALRPAVSLVDHPPTGGAPLGPVRAAVAIVSLLFFVLLFMPTPLPL